VTGEAATELIAERLEALRLTAAKLGAKEEDVPDRVEALMTRLKEAEKVGRAPRSAASRLDAAAALHEGKDAGKTKVVIASYPEADAGALRGLADDLRAMTGRFVAVVGGTAGDGKPSLLVAASRDLTAEGFDAGEIIRAAAPIIRGGGGGRADLAQAGGKDASRLPEALEEAGRLALEALQRIESA
jgi:alanyl-tRNA synthetase